MNAIRRTMCTAAAVVLSGFAFSAHATYVVNSIDYKDPVTQVAAPPSGRRFF